MVFSSVPLFQLDPPNWQQHLPGRVYDDDDNNNSSHPPPPMPPDHGVSIRPSSMAERARLTKLQQQETAHKCPRCASTNTKFCYYNNYSLSQPRHFCKTCRRYWTRGGALRNVPVGGGFRRNKRSKRSRSKSPVTAGNSPTSSCTTDNIVGHVPPSILPQFPLLPSINSITDLGAEDINRFSFRGIINQPPTTTAGGYSDQWRMQEYPFLCQFQSEGVKEFTSQYGIKTVDSCGPSQTDILVKIEENQGLMSFPGNEQQYWSNGNAWNQMI